MTGNDPASSAWKAVALPLSYTRTLTEISKITLPYRSQFAHGRKTKQRLEASYVGIEPYSCSFVDYRASITLKGHFLTVAKVGIEPTKPPL